MTKTAPATAKQVMKGTELDISSMNPDADGDGFISPMERKIYNALKAADVDDSGSIGVKELYGVIAQLVGAKHANKQLGKIIAVLLVVIVLSLGSLFAVSLVAGESLKESHVNGADMVSISGEPVRVDYVQSTTTLWDIPAVDNDALSKLKSLNFYADLSTMAGIGSWTEATFQMGGVYKASDDVAHLITTSGERITIRRTAKTGDIVIDGTAYPISDECTGACVAGSRRLSTVKGETNVVFKNAPTKVNMNRRMMRRGASAQSYGTFSGGDMGGGGFNNAGNR